MTAYRGCGVAAVVLAAALFWSPVKAQAPSGAAEPVEQGVFRLLASVASCRADCQAVSNRCYSGCQARWGTSTAYDDCIQQCEVEKRTCRAACK
jgi:hypothetical protein